MPAPTGGWNTRDTLAALPILDAVRLTNYFPASLGEVVTRGGCLQAAWNIGAASPAPTIRSLYSYGTTLGASLLFAVADSGIFDISSGYDQLHAAPNQVLTNGYWNAVQQTNSVGDNFLWGVNGTDTPKMFNGTVWSTPAITGPNPQNLIWPLVFKRRLWCVEKESMSLWYSDVDSVQGAFAEFPVGGLFGEGGYVVSAANWTMDGGSGPDDYLVIITSQGEVAIYQGVDPASATSFSIVGVFKIGPPLGRRCWLKLGGDLVILTEQGAYQLSEALKSAIIDARAAVSSKIQPTFIALAGLYRGTLGWEGVIFPNRNAMLVNVPIIGAGESTPMRSQQLVMNTLTGAWCDFVGWNAACFCMFESELYFGAEGGKVFKAWSTEDQADDGANIVYTGQTSFNYLGKSPGLKTVDAVRPLLAYDERFDLAWGLAVDFELPGRLTGYAPRSSVIGQSYWDEAIWDLAYWSLETARQAVWRTPMCRPGYCFSLVLQVTSDVAKVSWSGHDFLVNVGGPL